MLCERAGGDLPFHRLMTSGAPLVALVIRHQSQLSPYLSTGQTDLSSAHLLIEGYDDTKSGSDLTRMSSCHQRTYLKEGFDDRGSDRIGVLRFARTPRRPEQLKPSAWAPTTSLCPTRWEFSLPRIYTAITQSAWCRRPTADANGWVSAASSNGAEQGAAQVGGAAQPVQHHSDQVGRGRIRSLPENTHILGRQSAPQPSRGAWSKCADDRAKPATEDHGGPASLQAQRPMRRTLRHGRPTWRHSRREAPAPEPPATSPPILDACSPNRP